MATLQEELRELRKLRLQKDKSKATAAADEMKFKIKQQQVYDRMDAEEVGTMTDKRTKVQYVPTETTYAQIQDRSEFIKWALENEPELVVEKENEGELNALVRARIDDGESLPPGVGFRVRQYISQKAA